MDYLKEAGLGGTTAISISVVVSILFVIGMWKMFSKAGELGWASIIPIYNLYVLFKITWGKGAKFLLLLIPIYNIVVFIKTELKLARAFGKGTGFAVGLIFFSPIFYAILGFSDAQYLGVPDQVVY